MLNWKQEVIFEFHENPDHIGRETARRFGVPWSSMWDLKKALLDGTITYESTLTKPKILLFDIETAPMAVWNWSLFQNYTTIDQIEKDWFMLSWAAKWLDEDEVYNDNLLNHVDFDEELDTETVDLEVVASLYQLINEADIIVGHNLKRFDDKKAKARYLKHGFVMPEPYRKVDTLEIAKREFALSSNKLDYLATYLGFDNKVEHEGFKLWTKCMAGDPIAWMTMQEYNDYDTVLLENVYKAIRGWDTKHPNVATYYNDVRVRCTNCGSDDLDPLKSTAKTNLGSYDTLRCNCCGKISRTGSNNLTKQKRQSLLRNIA